MQIGDFVKVVGRNNWYNGEIGVYAGDSGYTEKVRVEFPDGGFDYYQKRKLKVVHPKYAVSWTDDSDPMQYFTSLKDAQAFAKKTAKRNSVTQVTIMKLTQFVKGGK